MSAPFFEYLVNHRLAFLDRKVPVLGRTPSVRDGLTVTSILAWTRTASAHHPTRHLPHGKKELGITGDIDFGDGSLLRLPAMRACTHLRIGDKAPTLVSAAEVDNYVEWLHLPTDGLYSSGRILPPFAARHLLNLKVTDEVFASFLEAIIEVRIA